MLMAIFTRRKCTEQERNQVSRILSSLPMQPVFSSADWPLWYLYETFVFYGFCTLLDATLYMTWTINVNKRDSSKRKRILLLRRRSRKRSRKRHVRFKWTRERQKRRLKHCYSFWRSPRRRRRQSAKSVHDWGNIPKDKWYFQDGQVVAEAFDAMMDKCPDFYLFGLIDKIIDSGDCKEAYFLGGINDHLQDLFLPDRQGFLYYNEALEDLPVIFDSGATISVSPDIRDFIEYEEIATAGITNITGQSSVRGRGKVKWLLYDDKGVAHEIITEAYFVPDAKVRLFSVQLYLGKNAGSFHMEKAGAHFTFPSNAQLTFRTFDIHSGKCQLPLAYLSKAVDYRRKSDESVYNVLSTDNANLTLAQKELLGWHYKLSHFHIRWIQRLTTVPKNGESAFVPMKEKGLRAGDLPLCEACRLAKATLLPDKTTTIRIKESKDGALKKNVLRPGAVVSTDQFVSSVRGRLPHTQGREKEKEQYSGGTIYVDEASGLIFSSNQVSLNANETLRGKARFERFAQTCGVDIVSYRGDNGVFKSKMYQDDLQRKKQSIRFSGVGAHHQNGVAERSIRTVSESARSMLIHAAIHWPEETSIHLWPFAMDYAIYVYNRLPKAPQGQSPLEIFTGAKQDNTWVNRSRVFGCPAYVLDPTIQDGQKLPRWKPKSRRGQFLGRSKTHASDIGLIRNLKTGYISTQYHVIYDDFYTTVSAKGDAPPSTWQTLNNVSRESTLDPNEAQPPPALDDSWLESEEAEIRAQRRRVQNRIRPRVFNDSSTTAQTNRNTTENEIVDTDINQNETDIDDTRAQDFEGQGDTNNDIETLPTLNEYLEQEAPELLESPPDVEERTNIRRSSRNRTRNSRYYNEDFITDLPDEEEWSMFVNDLLPFSEKEKNSFYEACNNLERNNLDEFGLLTDYHPLSQMAKLSNDSPKFHEAMNGPFADQFYDAMQAEMETLEKIDPWEIVPRESAQDENVLDTTWAFKTKRFPDGSVRKYKARICVRGDQQQHGYDFFDTYAPVVSWNTVRLLLILTAALGLSTKQVDYTLAFVQAKLDPKEPPVYIEMPRLFEKPGHILRLKRSLYGLRQSPLNFFLHLKKGLEERGFVQSKFDPCLFSNNKVICLVYVDDCLFFGKESKDIDAIIRDLQEPEDESKEKFLLNEEDDVAGFLGILFQKETNEKGEIYKIKLTQTGLIKRILAVTGMNDCARISTPAEIKTLGKDEEGDPPMERWSYASVVGMLMYLASNSRPDIAFAVHQCARFCHCTRRSHERAVKRIVRYLQGTKEEGLVIKPTQNLRIDLYADADFAGLWNSEDPCDPICTRSRTGFIITIGGIPLVWKSKLQTETALSTMESEYIALSMSMRDLVSIKELMYEVGTMLGVETSKLTLSRVFEDNDACRKLAFSTMPKMTPRSKHIAVKYHWFREKLDELNIEILRVDTKEQLADIFTKGLVQKEFESKRLLVCGW